MSQSDYIEYKRRAVELKKQTNLPPVLSSDQYIAFKQFSAENNIASTSQVYNQLKPAGIRTIFDIDRRVGSCPVFIVDKGTQARPNRVPLGKAYMFAEGMDPLPVSNYVKFPKGVCRACCADTRDKQINNTNTLFSLCKINRLKNEMCKCSMK